MEEDEDSFLYGDSIQPIPPPPVQKTPANEAVEIIPVPAEALEKQTNGIIAHLEAEAEAEVEAAIGAEGHGEEQNQNQDRANGDTEELEGDDEGEEEEEGEEESDEDIEFILEPPTRSLDFRSQSAQRGGHRPNPIRTPSAGVPNAPVPPANLTTEYTPRERGLPADSLNRSTSQASFSTQEAIPRPESAAPAAVSLQPTAAEQPPTDGGLDPSTLPPTRAPPSHPVIDPNVPGVFDGRSIFEIDMTNLAEKPWRRPGSDLSDWFNYGFDELSWEAYCYRRRALGEMAGVLKANVMGFAGMPEEQLLALPPEARTMVMTGTNAMMAATGGGVPGPGPGVGVGPGMMPPVGMNPMGAMNPMMAAEMGGMGGMGPMGVGMGGPMGMGMNGDMGVGMSGPGPGPNAMMQDGPPNGPVQVSVQGPGVAGPSGTPEQGVQMVLPDGIQGGPGPGMMNLNMGGEFSPMQDGNGIHNQQMFPGMENNGPPTPVPVRNVPAPGQFRGRGGMGMGIVPRGGRAVSTFPARGRGRGAIFDGSTLPVRPASPLPPNVPTGPRNPGNRYKDRDNNAPAVDGLDYGGNKESSGTPSNERDKERDRERDKERDRDHDKDEKPTSRKRRSPPSNEEDRMGRSSKRR
ncbi:hypothetical protein DFH11DRAFT_760107 [Phellopilus nigrolimitatus]|nr:hypothetical protein DFH11DRAFT_760107 [Phellopilus nigrolimitatus]